MKLFIRKGYLYIYKASSWYRNTAKCENNDIEDMRLNYILSLD